jgi:hypothetical protein
MHSEDDRPVDQPDMTSDISPAETSPRDLSSSRRDLLRLSALGGAAIITVRPGMAQAAASVNMCTITVPDPGHSTKWIAADGSLVSKNTKNAYAGPSAPLKAVDIKNSLSYGTSYPGYDSGPSSAYTNYIKKLTQGTAGFTCFASLQNPAK